MNPCVESIAEEYDDEFVNDTGISGDRVFEVFFGLIIVPMIIMLIVVGLIALI